MFSIPGWLKLQMQKSRTRRTTELDVGKCFLRNVFGKGIWAKDRWLILE